MIESWLPRMRCIARSGSATRSTPSSTILPRTICAASGNRPSSASAVIDLPQPDSPTSATTSPAPTANDTPSTIDAPSISTVRSSTVSAGASDIAKPLADARLRIEPIAQPVAEHVDREYQQEQAPAGKGHDPPGALHILPADAHDRSPARRRRLDAKPEERQAGLEQDHQAEFGGGDHQQGTCDVRQHMAKQNARGAGAGELGGLDVGQRGDLQGLAEGDAGIAGPSRQA